MLYLRCLFLLLVSSSALYAGTIAGTLQGPSGLPIKNGTLSFNLLQAGLLAGSGAVFAHVTLDPRPEEAADLAKVTRWGSMLALSVCPLITLVLILRLGGEVVR